MAIVGITGQISRWLVARLDVRGERGATAVEYGVILVLIAAAIVVAASFLGRETDASFRCVTAPYPTRNPAC